MGKLVPFGRTNPDVSEEDAKTRENFNRSIPSTTAREASERRSIFRVVKGEKK